MVVNLPSTGLLKSQSKSSFPANSAYLLKKTPSSSFGKMDLKYLLACREFWKSPYISAWEEKCFGMTAIYVNKMCFLSGHGTKSCGNVLLIRCSQWCILNFMCTSYWWKINYSVLVWTTKTPSSHLQIGLSRNWEAFQLLFFSPSVLNL